MATILVARGTGRVTGCSSVGRGKTRDASILPERPDVASAPATGQTRKGSMSVSMRGDERHHRHTGEHQRDLHQAVTLPQAALTMQIGDQVC